MSQKEKEINNANPAANGGMGIFGDMTLLREIIMGPKIIEYEERFTNTTNHINQNEESTRQRLANLERDMNARFDRLEKLLAQHVDTINTQMHNMSKNDKSDLADMLIEVSKKLKGK